MVTESAVADELLDAPLGHSFSRVRSSNPYLRVQFGTPTESAGWFLTALLDPNQHVLDEHFAIMTRQYETNDLDVLVRFYFGGFIYYLAGATVGPFMVDRRVPILEPATLGTAR